MRVYVLTLHGKRGDFDRVHNYYWTLKEALWALYSINDMRALTGFGPAVASLRTIITHPVDP